MTNFNKLEPKSLKIYDSAKMKDTQADSRGKPIGRVRVKNESYGYDFVFANIKIEIFGTVQFSKLGYQGGLLGSKVQEGYRIFL